MTDNMMAKPKSDTQEIIKLNPDGLKELGLDPDASFSDAMAAVFEKAVDKFNSLKTPEEKDAHFAEIAARQGMTPQDMRAQIEELMGKSEDELCAMVMEGPFGRLIEQDLIRSAAQKGTLN